MSNYISGFVAIIGRPNTGKSTLLNRLVGQKVAIVSPKSHTTRNTIRGICTTEAYQIVFLDTPGIARPLNRLGEFMRREGAEAREGSDLTLVLLDAAESFGPTDRAILQSARPGETFVLLNKADLATAQQLQAMESAVKELGFKRVYAVSAQNGQNIDKLLEDILAALPQGPQYFPPEMPADISERFLCAEVIREQMLHLLAQEVPHDVGVDVVKMEESDTLVRVMADIFCTRPSQKVIIIGQGGGMIKRIGAGARAQLEELLGTKVFLELFVKVEPDWQNKNSALKQLGYR